MVFFGGMNDFSAVEKVNYFCIPNSPSLVPSPKCFHSLATRNVNFLCMKNNLEETYTRNITSMGNVKFPVKSILRYFFKDLQTKIVLSMCVCHFSWESYTSCVWLPLNLLNSQLNSIRILQKETSSI